jgi:hypothetical protein
MPGPIRRAVERAVKRVVGNQKVTPALKAAIIAPATAAALAVPGVQPYAVAVPIVLNEILNAMIAQAKDYLQPGSAAGAKSAIPAGIKAGLQKTRRAIGPGAASIDALRDKLIAAKATAKTALEAKRAAVAEPKKKIPIAAIGAGAALLAFLAFRGRK